MPRTSRKANFNFNNYTSTKRSKYSSGAASSSAATSGAALSVTKFGQTTYTSIRRQKEGENASFVPLKAALENNGQKKDNLAEEVSQETLTSISKVDNSPKPKVYKFFKSRSAPSDQSPNGKQESANSNTTKQISPTPKTETPKRFDLVIFVFMFLTCLFFYFKIVVSQTLHENQGKTRTKCKKVRLVKSCYCGLGEFEQ